MASRIMHYAIATLINKQVHIKDVERFILGNLAPDMSSHDDGTYDIAHVGGVNQEKTRKGINYAKFYFKYQNRILEDDFILGYFTHLICDAYWYSQILDPLIRVHNKETRKKYMQEGYKDMRAYNPILIERFQLRNIIKSVDDVKDNVISIDEINLEYIDNYLQQLQNDFEEAIDNKYKFQIYCFDMILDYINKCTKRCINEINSIRTLRECSNPEKLYAPVRYRKLDYINNSTQNRGRII